MAERKTPVPKSTIIEAAIQKTVGQLAKDLAKRAWTPGAHAAMITYIVEGCGVKLNDDQKKAIRKELLDSDCQYTSNMRAYLVLRGLLPEKVQAETGDFA